MLYFQDELLNCCIPGDMVEEMKGDITEKMLNHSNKNPELYVESHYQDVRYVWGDKNVKSLSVLNLHVEMVREKKKDDWWLTIQSKIWIQK